MWRNHRGKSSSRILAWNTLHLEKREEAIRVTIREHRKQLQEEEETRTEVEAKYKKLKKIHKSTKNENNIYQTEILKLKHGKDTAEEVMTTFCNASFNKYKLVQQQIKNNNYRNLIQYWKQNTAWRKSLQKITRN